MILICRTGQPNSGQPWHSPVPQWHTEEWLTVIFQLWSQFPLPSLPRATAHILLPFKVAKVPLFITTSNNLQTGFSQVLVNKALFGGRQAAWVLNRDTITTMLQMFNWRWLNQTVLNYTEDHFSNACFLFINFDTGWTENKYIKNLHQILTSSEGQQLKWLPSQGHTYTTQTGQLSWQQRAFDIYTWD